MKEIEYGRPIASMEAEKYLSGNIKYLAVSSSDAICLNDQSCDCQKVVIGTDQGLLMAEHDAIDCNDEEYDKDEWDGRIVFYSIDKNQTDGYDLMVIPHADSMIQLKQICRDKKGRIRAIKFLFGSRILYLFAMDDLVITKSVNELMPEMFDDETGNEIKDDDSVLFE